MPEINYSSKVSPDAAKIGEHIASPVENGATLQLGIGGIPDQVLKNLINHRNLGFHTKMLADGIIPLIQNRGINNSCKKLNKGRSVTGFIAGIRRLYDFVNDNPKIRVMGINYVIDTSMIRLNPKATVINSAI